MTPSPASETKPSNPAAVDAYFLKMRHPMADLGAVLRTAILAADKRIGEEIKWNTPAFFLPHPTTASAPHSTKSQKNR